MDHSSNPPLNSGLTQIAKGISALLHPILVPFLLVVYFSMLNESYWPSLAYGFILLSFLPLAASLLYFRHKKIENVYVIERKHRIFPLIFTLFFYCLFGLLNYFSGLVFLPSEIILILLFYHIIAFTITLFWKISFHMIGAGALLGFGMSIGAIPGNMWLMLIGVIICASVYWARKYLKAHEHLELIGGAVLGAGLIGILDLIF